MSAHSEPTRLKVNKRPKKTRAPASVPNLPKGEKRADKNDPKQKLHGHDDDTFEADGTSSDDIQFAPEDSSDEEDGAFEDKPDREISPLNMDKKKKPEPSTGVDDEPTRQPPGKSNDKSEEPKSKTEKSGRSKKEKDEAVPSKMDVPRRKKKKPKKPEIAEDPDKGVDTEGVDPSEVKAELSSAPKKDEDVPSKLKMPKKKKKRRSQKPEIVEDPDKGVSVDEVDPNKASTDMSGVPKDAENDDVPHKMKMPKKKKRRSKKPVISEDPDKGVDAESVDPNKAR